jgi:hypothetical protein
VKRHILYDTVALVEDGQHRDALAHRGHAGLIHAGRRRGIGDHRLRGVLLIAFAARDKRERQDQSCGRLEHAYSGIHGS